MKLFATPALLVGATLAGSLLAQQAAAQCATCPQPTVALSPVTQTACSPVLPQPTVALSPVAVQQPIALQTYQPTRRLFTGYWLRRLFGYRDPVVAAPVAPVAAAPTFVTAAYQPTYPLTAAVLTPRVQTVARPIALAPTSFRAVTMSPVASCPSCCPTSCCPTPGVTQAGFTQPACPSCAGGSSTFNQPAPFTQPAPTPAGETPQPGLSPGASVPEQRLRPTPGDDRGYLDPNDIGPAPAAGSGSRETFGPATGGSGTKSDAYYQAPQLFDPNSRTTSRPAAPVWNAVYHQAGNASAGGQVFRVGPDASQASYAAPRREQQGAGGWRSVRD